MEVNSGTVAIATSSIALNQAGNGGSGGTFEGVGGEGGGIDNSGALTISASTIAANNTGEGGEGGGGGGLVSAGFAATSATLSDRRLQRTRACRAPGAGSSCSPTAPSP